MFGDWDGLILRILITAIVVLVLVGVVYWLVRRYSTGGLGRIGRGRVPRLAVVDAMAVDGRRRLVLVRRDNVEHLILIGGPSDVVVEQAIQRPRARPAAKPLASAAPPPAPQPFPAPDLSLPEMALPDNPPLPFPQLRVPAAPPEPELTPTPSYRVERDSPVREAPAPAPPPTYQSAPQPIERPFPPLRRSNSARAEAATPPPPAPVEVTAELPLSKADEAPAQPFAPYENGADGSSEALPEFLRPRIAEEPSFAAPPPPPLVEDTAAKVNDLEREMARLLGEITQKR